VQNDLDFENAVTECRNLLKKSPQRRKVEGFYSKGAVKNQNNKGILCNIGLNAG